MVLQSRDGWMGGVGQRGRNVLLFLITFYILANILSPLLYKTLSQKEAVDKIADSSCQEVSPMFRIITVR